MQSPKFVRLINALTLLLILVGVLYLYFFTPFYTHLKPEIIKSYLSHYESFSILVFWLLNLLAVLFFVPLTLFWIVAGMLFGTLTGTLLTASASTCAAALAYLMGRKNQWLAQSFILKHARSKHWKDKLEHGMQGNSFTILFIIRVLPHPFILFSYLAGFVETIKLSVFTLATLAAIVPLSFAFVLLGDSLLNDLRIIVLPVLLIALMIGTTKAYQYFQDRRDGSPKVK
jgi:uncharacterized membrane protein YdjX (TVP38/TMEM64 family)